MTRINPTVWKPIEAAPRNCTRVLARDDEGTERWTWFEDGSWCFMTWRENEDQEEYECEQWWHPVEFETPIP